MRKKIYMTNLPSGSNVTHYIRDNFNRFYLQYASLNNTSKEFTNGILVIRTFTTGVVGAKPKNLVIKFSTAFNYIYSSWFNVAQEIINQYNTNASAAFKNNYKIEFDANNNLSIRAVNKLNYGFRIDVNDSAFNSYLGNYQLLSSNSKEVPTEVVYKEDKSPFNFNYQALYVDLYLNSHHLARLTHNSSLDLTNRTKPFYFENNNDNQFVIKLETIDEQGNKRDIDLNVNLEIIIET